MIDVSHSNSFPPSSQKKSLPVLDSKKYCEDILTEWSWGLGLTGMACAFAETSCVANSLIKHTVNLLGVNFFIRNSFSRNNISDFALSYNASRVARTTGNIVVHELGHKAAILLIHKKAQPKIFITGLFSGATSWIPSKYTSLGKFLGPLHSRALIAASGPLLAIVFATIGIIFAFEWNDQKNYLIKNILFSSFGSIIDHVLYALSAFFADPNNLSHDFICLWHYGINPYISAAIIVLIPLVTLIFRNCLNKKNRIC